MATYPRNSSLTDLQWDLAVGERNAIRFIDFVDRSFPNLIDAVGSVIAVPALDELYKMWNKCEEERNPFNASMVATVFESFSTPNISEALARAKKLFPDAAPQSV